MSTVKRETVEHFRARLERAYDRNKGSSLTDYLLVEIAVQLKRVADSLEDGVSIVTEKDVE